MRRTTEWQTFVVVGVDAVEHQSHLHQYRFERLGVIFRWQHLDESSNLLFARATQALQCLQLHQACMQRQQLCRGFQDNATGANIRLKRHGHVFTRDTPKSITMQYVYTVEHKTVLCNKPQIKHLCVVSTCRDDLSHMWFLSMAIKI